MATETNVFGKTVCAYCGYHPPQHGENCDRPANPDGTMEDALSRCSDRVSELLIENQRMRAALQRINAMDYRGNRSPEQDIARAALIVPDKTNPDGR